MRSHKNTKKGRFWHNERTRRSGPEKKDRAAASQAPYVQKPVKSSFSGELRLHRDGYGFVVPGDGSPDLFIPARFVGDALHTDLVEARVVAEKNGKREGRIIRVLEHRVLSLMGRLERKGTSFQVIADDRRVHHRILIPNNKLAGSSEGQNVVVRILQYSKAGQPMQGEVIQILGRRGDDETERAAVIARHQLHREFPSAAAKEAKAVRRFIDEAAAKERRDLRNIPFVTIDGETAKDFDDAVAAEKLEDGVIRLWVSIADVSYFVRPNTALDKAAYERGTSVYFPGDCIPMLPEDISNDLCSLRPKEDRLTFTAEMDLDLEGNVIRRNFYRSIICSRERLTYTAVKQVLVEQDAAVIERYREIVPELLLMRECFERMRKQRIGRGSIDFDLPEPEIVMDMQGDISDIVRSQRHVGHMMIEEFMVAANEAVAEFLSESGAGCIYRVHEQPPSEKLQDFRMLLHNLGYRMRIGDNAPPGALAKVVEAVRGKPEERLVNHMLLRSLAQAAYSAKNIGHYGLASRCYCHFTSPIRRYPDLVVHRLLAQALQSARHVDRGSWIVDRNTTETNESRITNHEPRTTKVGVARLQEIAEHCSRRERIAMEAERETAKLCAAMFMQNHVEKEFDGIISHVAKFGFFVELIDYFVEGLVHVSSLDDDHYIYDENGMTFIGKKKKKAFKVGDKVRIMVEEVNIPDREILFTLV